MTAPLTWKARIGLALFGVTFAVGLSALALQFVSFGPKGTEFDSIDDVRRAMLSDTSPQELGNTDDEPVSLRGIVQPHSNDKIIYTLKPNLNLRFIRANVQTNSCGMRSPERPVAKAPGVYRIALLGDSFAFGWGVEENETFAYHLEETLNRVTGGSPRVEVLNFGVPGYSTFQEVALFEEIGLDFQPDAALVYFVENDFGMPFFIRDLEGGDGILSSLKFVQLGKKLLAPGEVKNRISKLGLDPSQALRRLDEVTSKHGIKTYFTINPRKNWRKQVGRLWGLRNGSAIEVLPLRESLLEYMERHNIPEKDLTLSYDPHPSPIRHKILGLTLASYFLEDIR